MTLTLIWKNLLHKPLNAQLCWLLLTLSTGIISTLLILQYRFETQFAKNAEGVDMVLGAKGSPLQLILSSVYQMDAPTGNINLKAAQPWMRHPFVEKAIPLSYGDSYKNFRILGTTPAFIERYTVRFSKGTMFRNNFEVVAGSEAAAALHLQPGEHFFSTHGQDGHGEEHTEHPYVVTGILQPTGTIADKLLICNLESVWAMHEHPSAAAHQDEHNADEHTRSEAEHHHHGDSENKESLNEPGHPHTDRDKQEAGHENEPHEHAEQEKEITAVLLQFRNPMGLMQLPRIINTQTNMMAAVPAIEVNRLFGLMGIGIDVLKKIGAGLMFLAALSIFVALFNALRERKYELALMRTLGAGPARMALLLLLEGVCLSIAGLLSGLLLSRLLLVAFAKDLASGYSIQMAQLGDLYPGEIPLAATVLACGALAALLPAIKASFLNISKTLSHA